MKKWTMAILLFDLMAGLLFLRLWEEQRFGAAEAASGAVVERDGKSSDMETPGEQAEDIRKIALTFDDGVIVGLSQELLV